MAETLEAESGVLELAANNLISEGYKVLFQPPESQLPPELKGFRPDGIAIGKKPYLIIEIARPGQGSEQLIKLQEALKENANWKLHVVLDRGEAVAPISSTSLDNVENVLNDVRDVAKKDTRVALLGCWASLEALARVVEPKNFARPQTPGRIIEQLASLSYLVPSEAQFLREMASKRNEFIHGQLSVAVTDAEIVKFVELLNDLLAAARKQGLE